MATIAHIFRHPIKGVGVEEIATVDLTAHATMPWDRVWAVAHQAARLNDGWNPCVNFIRGAKTGTLMATRAQVDEGSGNITLTHPDRPEITLDPDTDPVGLVEWITPLCDPARALPQTVVRVPGRGMTDSDFPSISILNLASLRALSDRMGLPLDPRRFRGNLWFDGDGPWVEWDWIGKRLTIGTATFEVRERITRCKATTIDPDTGRARGDTLAALDAGWGHQDLGIYAEMVDGGTVTRGDEVTVQ